MYTYMYRVTQTWTAVWRLLAMRGVRLYVRRAAALLLIDMHKLYMHIYAYICTHVYIYVQGQSWTSVRRLRGVRPHVRRAATLLLIDTYIDIYAFIYAHIYAQIYTYMFRETLTLNPHQASARTYIYTSSCIYLYIYICMYISIHTHMYTYVYWVTLILGLTSGGCLPCAACSSTCGLTRQQCNI